MASLTQLRTVDEVIHGVFAAPWQIDELAAVVGENDLGLARNGGPAQFVDQTGSEFLSG